MNRQQRSGFQNHGQRLIRRGVFRGLNPVVTTAASALVGAWLLMGAVWTDTTSRVLSVARDLVGPVLEWYYVLLVVFLLSFVLWLGLGRYRDIRLGGDHVHRANIKGTLAEGIRIWRFIVSHRVQPPLDRPAWRQYPTQRALWARRNRRCGKQRRDSRPLSYDRARRALWISHDSYEYRHYTDRHLFYYLRRFRNTRETSGRPLRSPRAAWC